MDDKDKALIEEALKVYGIPPQWVLASVTSHIKLTRYSYNRLMFCNKG